MHNAEPFGFNLTSVIAILRADATLMFFPHHWTLVPILLPWKMFHRRKSSHRTLFDAPSSCVLLRNSPAVKHLQKPFLRTGVEVCAIPIGDWLPVHRYSDDQVPMLFSLLRDYIK